MKNDSGNVWFNFGNRLPKEHLNQICLICTSRFREYMYYNTIRVYQESEFLIIQKLMSILLLAILGYSFVYSLGLVLVQSIDP